MARFTSLLLMAVFIICLCFIINMSKYFSVCIMKGTHCLQKRIIECPLVEAVGDLTGKCLATCADSTHLVINEVFASENKGDLGNVVAMTTPLQVLADFNLNYVTVNVNVRSDEGVLMDNGSTPNKPNAFSVLMTGQQFDRLPNKFSNEKLKGDQKMYNDIIDLLQKENIGFSLYNVEIVGKTVCKTLCKVLWYTTSQHDKFIQRGIQLPDMFNQFSGGYFDNVQAHKAPMKMEVSKLSQHIDALSEVLMLPWTYKYKKLYQAIEQLADSLKKYVDFLSQQSKRNKDRDTASEPLRNPNVNFSLVPIEATGGIVKDEYCKVNSEVSDMDVYTPLELSSFVPDCRYKRRAWIDNLQLSVPVAHYSYFQGNYLGNIHFVWRLPNDVKDRSEELTVKAVQIVHKSLPTYATRQMKQEFYNKYQSATNVSPALLRNMYRFLTDDSSAPESEEQAVIDKRVEEVLALNDPDVAWDLRRLNGKPDSNRFDSFWDEIDKYFHERDLAVQERRHGTQLYLPYAISIEDLVSTIRSRVDPEVPIPSNEWVRLQFWPANPTTKTAVHYTGRFNVKFSLQTRQIRGRHEDSHFVAAQLVYLKTFAVRFREYVDFFWLDDKAIVPVGEPGLPVSTGVRPHNASLSKAQSSLTALDHDYNVCGAIPSVAFHCDIPLEASESFFSGTAFVTVKDKVFSPSHALRHGAETTNIIKSYYCDEDNVNAEKPILILYTDGGPDHRTTFGSVQLASIAMFIWLDLDMLVTARTAPMGSWANLAERINSILNLALQNVSLERERMTEELEMRMKRVSTLKTARDTATRYPAFKEGLKSAVLPVLKLLEERFSHLKLKGEPILINSPANEEAIENFFKILKDVLDGSLDQNKLTKKDLDKSDNLNKFMDRHCRCRQYMFQIKKCDPQKLDDCSYCIINPPRLPHDVYAQLNYVPDPVLSSDSRDKFEVFDSVYGTATDDSARPSLSSTVSETAVRDKRNKKLLTANKVRDCVKCVECGKQRCVYSDTKLSYNDRTALIRVKELNTYTCGSPLFPSSAPYYETLVVREGLRCSSLMETTYYASVTCSLPSVCFHCGIARSEDFADDSDIQELQAKFSVVRPICRACKQLGKEAVVRGKRNVKRLRKS